MKTMQTLDVRIIEPRLKHLTIFKTFDELPINDSFIIVNDHDPKPMHHLFMAERPEKFTWVYLKEGPLEWKVKISKKNTREKTIGQLAAEDYKKALVFKKLGIDFCCGGKKTLTEAAKEKGLDLSMIEEEFKSIPDNTSENNHEYFKWKTGEIINHILEFHHRYVKKTLPEMTQILFKVVNVHSADHPELIEISKNFISMAEDLLDHMEKEEKLLFPYIQSLETYLNDSYTPQKPILQEAILALEEDHKTAAEYFENIRKLTNNYALPPGACGSYRILYISIHEFEQDLKQHVHLENNILFPKALELENIIFN